MKEEEKDYKLRVEMLNVFDELKVRSNYKPRYAIADLLVKMAQDFAKQEAIDFGKHIIKLDPTVSKDEAYLTNELENEYDQFKEKDK